MRTYPGVLTNAVRSALRSKHDLMLENLALRQQLAVLTRQRARTRTKPADRLFWSWLSRYWPGWRSTPVMVQPETVIRWHRTAWRMYWTWKSRARHPGRPRISKELQGLIARIATENPRWGAVRIQRELLALGYEVSAETVRCYRRTPGSCLISACTRSSTCSARRLRSQLTYRRCVDSRTRPPLRSIRAASSGRSGARSRLQACSIPSGV